MSTKSKPFDDYLLEQLKDDAFRKAYLRDCLQEEDARIFLKTLYLAIKASDKTIQEVADAAGMSRENVSRSLYGDDGNPSFHAVFQILHRLGYDFSIRKRTTSRQSA